jgi:hypothetical protein
MVGRATTAALRVIYAAFALVWVAFAIRSAREGNQQEAIVYAAVAPASPRRSGTTLSVTMMPMPQRIT